MDGCSIWHAYARLNTERNVTLFHPGKAADAFLTSLVDHVEEDLLVRTSFDAMLVSSATFLIDQYDAVFFPLINRLAGTGCQAGRMIAVVAYACQIEHPSIVNASQVCSLVDHLGQVILAKIGSGIISLGRQVSNRRFTLAVLLKRGDRIELFSVPFGGAHFFHQPTVPSLGISAIGLGLNVVPENSLLAFTAGPASLASDGAGLAFDTLVRVEDVCHLTFGWRRIVRIVLLSTYLPIKSLDHSPFLS